MYKTSERINNHEEAHFVVIFIVLYLIFGIDLGFR